MARIVSQSDAFYPNFRVLMLQDKKFNPKANTRALDFDLEDTLDGAKKLVAEQFAPIRRGTLLALCSACENFVKVVAAERLAAKKGNQEKEFSELVDCVDRDLLAIKKLKPCEKYVALFKQHGISVPIENEVVNRVNEAMLVRNAIAHNASLPGRWLLTAFPEFLPKDKVIELTALRLRDYDKYLWDFCHAVYTHEFGPWL